MPRRSDHNPPYATYFFLDYVGTVIDAMDALKWDKAAIIGHSMGAGIAHIAAGCTDRFSKLVPPPPLRLLSVKGPAGRHWPSVAALA
jgi:pimeloyl-ACP methyl ester carboxylesterase